MITLNVHGYTVRVDVCWITSPEEARNNFDPLTTEIFEI